MARRSKSLTIHRGDDYPHTVTFTDGAGDPLDCSGWTVTSQIRATAAAADALVSFDVDDADAATGVFTLNLTAAETRALPTGNLASDIQRTLAGKTTTILSCPVLVVPGGGVYLENDAVLSSRECEFILFDSPGPQCFLSLRFGSGLIAPSQLPTPIAGGDYEAVRFTGEGFANAVAELGVVNLHDDQVRGDVTIYRLASASAFPGAEASGEVQTNAPGWMNVPTVPLSRVAVGAGVMPELLPDGGTAVDALSAIDAASA